jgi:hypothetical protein
MERKSLILAVCAMLLAPMAPAQFKSQVAEESQVVDGLMHNSSPSFFFGWFDPAKFHMRHSFDFSYMTFGGQGVSMGTYTNSMMYQFADNLNARADVSLSYSPYNSLSTFNKKNDLSSVYLSRAEVNYKPWDNVLMQFQYRMVPNGYYSSFYNPWYRENGF